MKKGISKQTIRVMLGLIVAMFALITIFSAGSIFDFLSKGILICFGFIGFWIIVPTIFLFGFYIIFKDKLSKYKIGISFIGVYIFLLFLLAIASSFSSNGFEVVLPNEENIATTYVVDMFKNSSSTVFVSFTNCTHILKEIALSFTESENHFDGFSIFNSAIGGGYIGFALLGCLNSLLTPVFAFVVCWVIEFICLLVIFNQPIKKLFKYIKNKKHRKLAREDVRANTYDVIGSKNEPEINYSNNNESFNDDDYNDAIKEQENINNRISALTEPSFDQKENYLEKIDNRNSLYQENPFASNENVIEKKEEPVSEVKPYENEIVSEEKEIEKSAVQAETNVKEIEQEDLSSSSFAPDHFEDDQFSQDFFDDNKDENLQEEPLIEEILPSFDREENVNDSLDNNENQEIKPVAIEEKTINETFDDELTSEDDKLVVEEEIEEIKYNDYSSYELTSYDVLTDHEDETQLELNEDDCIKKTEILNEAFQNLGVGAEVIDHVIGPTVTRYKVKTNQSVSINKVRNIITDLSIRIGGIPIRFEEIVPGEANSGLEIQNLYTVTVGLKECLKELDQAPKSSQYDIIFGRNINRQLVKANFTKFPHCLICGATGSGKSVFLHTTLLTLLMRNSPRDLRIMMIDPKKNEFMFYEDIPHLLCPIITDPNQAYIGLNRLMDEMERRNSLMSKAKVRDVFEYNELAKRENKPTLPVIACFIDEFANLKNENEKVCDPLGQLVAKARSTAIHVFVGTQRPSVDVISGVIKSNLNVRIVLRVTSGEDSRVGVGEFGCEKLVGNGDMLIKCVQVSPYSLVRIQAPFVNTFEINAVANEIRNKCKVEYDPHFLNLEDQPVEASTPITPLTAQQTKELQDETLYEAILDSLNGKEYYSINQIIRLFHVGSTRAGKLFQRLIEEGYVAQVANNDNRGSKILKKAPKSEEYTSTDQSEVYFGDKS